MTQMVCLKTLRIDIMTKEKKLPFECVVLENPEVIANPFSGEKTILQPTAVAVYDCIKGAEMVEEYDMVRKGIDWFREHYPKEYMVLLD